MKGNVTLVSAGLTVPKKPDNPAAQYNLYLNYGLIGLAGVLEGKGYSPTVFHGEFKAPKVLLASINQQGPPDISVPLLLSLPSVYCLPWAADFCREMRLRYPDWKIVCGGRWVIDGQIDWVRTKLPDVDLFVSGLAESRVADLLQPEKWASILGTSLTRVWHPQKGERPPVSPSYAIVEGFKRYQPAVELARGCGMGCFFCAERAVPLGKMKAPQVVAMELEERIRDYGDDRITPYFEASIFRPTRRWASELKNAFADRGIGVLWRSESRVDGINVDTLETLYAAGLRVLDIGLESASPRMLKAMGKTRNPENYLQRADKLLKRCKTIGIWCKLNLLLYPGETQETIKESADWLMSRASCIKGISAHPVIAFRSPDCAVFVARAETLGGTLTSPHLLEERGFARFHLSQSIDADHALAESRRLSRMIMTSRDYYDLKAFSYFKRGMNYRAFMDIVGNTPKDSLSFSLP